MLDTITNGVGAILSAPVDFLKGMGGGWKFGLLVGGLALVGGLTGILPDMTPQLAFGVGVGGTIAGGLGLGSINMVKEFLKSDEGQQLAQDGIEQVVEKVAPTRENELGELSPLEIAASLDPNVGSRGME